MAYFDRAVETETKRARFLNKIKTEPLWHTYLERHRELIQHIDWSSVDNVLEIGCGNARTLWSLSRPQENHYNYVGTDLSIKRLLLAKMLIPESDFVQCSALNLPFKNQTFDIVISFGVIHHLPNTLEGVKQCLSKLTPKGSFLLHEPMEKPRQLLPNGKWQFIKKMFETYKHSEHDNTLNIKKTLRVLEENRMTVKRLHYSGSTLRTVLARIVALFSPLRRNKTIWRCLLVLDRIFLKVFCTHPNRFGPTTAFFIAEKS